MVTQEDDMFAGGPAPEQEETPKAEPAKAPVKAATIAKPLEERKKAAEKAELAKGNVAPAAEAKKEEPVVQATAPAPEPEVEKTAPAPTAVVEKPSAASLVSKSMAKATVPGTLSGLKHTDIQNVISGMSAQIAQALPKHLTPVRVIQMATTYIAQNPGIAKCTASSLVGAIMQASILGLEPVQALGQIYFVPFRNNKGTRDEPKWVDEVQFQLGYKGYIRLAQNSGEIKMIYAEVVKEGDEFDFELGLHPKLKHKPSSEKEDAKITHAYAVVHYKDGGYNFVVITHKQIEALRMRSPMQKSGINGAWKTDYEAMAKGKAIKQLGKYLPLSIEAAKGFASDEGVFNEKTFTNNNEGLDIDKAEFTDHVDVTE
jgi:recombination protein RecT